jgi:hypothetical protein
LYADHFVINKFGGHYLFIQREEGALDKDLLPHRPKLKVEKFRPHFTKKLCKKTTCN